MRRTARLLEILLLFRSGKLLLGRDIADRLEVSVRTVYRDIDTLVASGIAIEGERGVGFMSREPIFLPPLTLAAEELRALHLGIAIVRQISGEQMVRAAEGLLGKISAALPAGSQGSDELRGIAVYADLQASAAAAAGRHLGTMRRAVTDHTMLEISYMRLDGAGAPAIRLTGHLYGWRRWMREIRGGCVRQAARGAFTPSIAVAVVLQGAELTAPDRAQSHNSCGQQALR